MSIWPRISRASTSSPTTRRVGWRVGHSFNKPFLNNLANLPVYKSDSQNIIPDMTAQYATGRMTLDQAIAWDEKEISEIYRKPRGCHLPGVAEQVQARDDDHCRARPGAGRRRRAPVTLTLKRGLEIRTRLA